MATNSIFESDTFEFRVGLEKTRFRLHRNVVEMHSRVLAAMMNNGKLQESLSGIAILEHVHPETFRLATEFMYTGIYRIESTHNLAGPLPSPPTEAPRRFNVSCFTFMCPPYEIQTLLSDIPYMSKKCKNCGAEWASVRDVVNGSNVNLKQVRTAQERRVDTPKDAFRTLSYPALGRDHEAFAQYLSTLHPRDHIIKKVSHHAMLFVFAQMYMMEPLARICLHKLHRDLLALEITAESISEIVWLITYSYENTPSTTRGNGNEAHEKTTGDGLGSALRKLVMTYAVTYAEKLSQFQKFQEMLRDGGELVGDYALGVTKRLIG